MILFESLDIAFAIGSAMFMNGIMVIQLSLSTILLLFIFGVGIAYPPDQ